MQANVALSKSFEAPRPAPMAAAPPRRVIGGRWELDKQIGKGSFAVVWRAREVPARVAPDREATGRPTREVPPAPPTASPPTTGFADEASSSLRDEKGVTRETETETGASKWVAVKEISTRRLNRKLLRSLESEIDVLRSCEHENIIALLDIVKDEPNQTVFLVLEHCALGDLSQYLRRVRRVAEPVARTFAAQIAGGLREMRARNLIHRDLKPQNLLLCRTPATDVRAEVKSGTASEQASLGSEKDASYTSATLKIADFGFARYVHPSGLAETLCGSPLYMAPEILSYQKYDAKADLWSVGCILFELVCGAPPFAGANPMALLRNITRGDARIPGCVAGELSRECVDLMRGLLQKDPARRMSHEQFFEHPFLKTNVRARRRDEKAPESFPKTETFALRDDARNFHPSDADSDSDSDASESSETLAASDPRAIALGTDGGGENVRDETRSPRRAGVPGSAPKDKTFSLPAAAERARDAAAAAGAWLGASPLGLKRGGSTFSKLLSSSPLSARKGMGLSGRSPRSPRPPRDALAAPLAAPRDADAADEMDAEYVLVETETRRAAAVDAEIGPEAVRPGPVPEPDVADARGRNAENAENEKGVFPVTPARAEDTRLRRAARLERAACALRDAAGEAWDAGERLDAVALSLVATAALRRAAALAWETSLRNEKERKATPEGFDAEDVAEASRRLDAAFEAALRRAERAASAAETMASAAKNSSFNSSSTSPSSRDGVVPDGMRATYAAALGWGRAAAAAELVGDAREAASTYARAHVLLSFLLSEGPGFCRDEEEAFSSKHVSETCHEPESAIPESRDGGSDGGSRGTLSAWRSAEERDRVARFADAFATRRAACLERT